jgi:surface protein
METFSFKDGVGDKLKLIEINNLGAVGWTNLKNAFDGCTNLRKFVGGDTSNVTSMASMFLGTTALKSLNLYTLDVRNVTDFTSMFQGTTALINLDTTGWDDVSGVIATDAFTGTNTGLNVYCGQPGGLLFGETCN